jgi:sugar-specific transcriptional regulator TrmB
MDNTQTAIRSYFAKLGLEAEIADIYLALHSHGPQNISALARNSKVERTRIYRLIDQLMESNLIEVEMDSKRGIIKAAPIANLRILINRREEELKNLHDELNLVEQTLARNSLSDPLTRVQLYRGPEGVRQMLSNQLESKSELLSYGYRSLEELLGKKFTDAWRTDIKKLQTGRRQLVNRSSALPGEISGDCRIVAEDLFRISFGCDIYDDVVAQCHWRGEEIFGLEIHNQAAADSQRQMFELLWRQAVPAGA